MDVTLIYAHLSPTQKRSFKFILLFGIISLLADVTYEGARSITGAYLGLLGASATVVGFVAGFGELAGYSLRLLSGYLVDKTERYWPITILGYVINLVAVPLLALTGNWMVAAALIIAERVGKAIRVPARDTMLSYAGKSIGVGFGFGLHEALDQIGAMLGPLIIAAVLYTQGSYREGFAVLGIPAVLAISTLFVARLNYPQPKDLESGFEEIHTQGINKIFWLYLIGASFIAAGYADFALIAYHFQKTKLLSPVWIPLSYALAMGVNSILAPLLGHFYDRKGFFVLIIVTVIATFFAPLIFLGNAVEGMIGVILWAIGIGAQQSLMRAIIANLISSNKRGSAYGIFNFAYGISWFIGSVLLGFLYDHSITQLVIAVFILQFASLPWLVIVMMQLSKFKTFKKKS